MQDFLPINKKDMQKRGWDCVDFVYVTGDAYIDHPSFGSAIISRLLESRGYRVGIIAQPDWRKKESIQVFGEPRLGFLVTAGNMDSMVNHYTVSRKHRQKDAYSPGGQMGLRPDMPTVVYSNLIRQTYKHTPIILGGIEASLRRLAHYDYWSNRVRRSVLMDSGADLISYGMGEHSIIQIAEALQSGIPVEEITYIPGTVFKSKELSRVYDPIVLPSFEAVTADKKTYAESFNIQYRNTDPFTAHPLAEDYGNRGYVIQNPPALPLTQQEMDDVYALPYMRDEHPVYKKDGGIPAFGEIKFSISNNRGCFGGCNFCALAFHQGRMVTSRSIESVLEEAELLTHEPGFKGYIHDVGGPSANFRHTSCQKQKRCGMCKNRSCLAPEPCPNLDADHSEYTELLRRMREIPGIKRVFVRSGIRYDYMLQDKDRSFFKELVKYHISGQLKVAPEHCVSSVLDYMGKPHFDVFLKFWRQYQKLNEEGGTEQYLVPYLMSSHPGCTLSDAVELAEFLHKNGRTPEQVQDFYPTPGTLSTCMYYTGIDPRDMSEVYVARDPKEKAMQRALLQWSRPEKRALVVEALEETGRTDLIGYEKKCLIRPRKGEPYGQPPVKPERSERPERQPRRKKEASGNRGRRGTPTAKPLAQKGKMSPRKKAAFAKKRNGK